MEIRMLGLELGSGPCKHWVLNEARARGNICSACTCASSLSSDLGTGRWLAMVAPSEDLTDPSVGSILD
ncbi:hypothetical protein R1flu_020909 [Riccia fluitans]|uniref:Uncharacterized protein n=1 Tax=Riccia fluitans TaxID=41844 RepID=A0ABD1ZPG2_9MARC